MGIFCIYNFCTGWSGFLVILCFLIMLYFCYLCTWWAILLPGLVLFSSCYTVMGLTLGIADLQSGALDFFSFCCSLMLSISMNLRVIYWVFWVSLFAFLFSICILGFVKILENIVPIKILNMKFYDCCVSLSFWETGFLWIACPVNTVGNARSSKIRRQF